MGISAKEIFEQLPKNRRNRINKMAIEQIAQYKNLQDLRKALGITQKMIADKQGVNQVNISNLEKRKDMHISTLKKYVEAMECELKISIIVPNKEVAQIQNL